MSSKLLENMVIAVSGTLPGRKHSNVERVVKEFGGKFEMEATSTCTHLITTQKDMDSPTKKVKEATKVKGCHIVSVDWLDECISKQRLERPQRYLLKPTNTSGGTGTGLQPKRRALEFEFEDGEGQRRKHRNTQVTNPKAYLDQLWEKDGVNKDDFSVLTEGGVAWDATMIALPKATYGDTPKICRLQLVFNTNSNDFLMGVREGPIHGPFTVTLSGSQNQMALKADFEYQFKEKSGLSWDSRGSPPMRSKFVFVERWYSDEPEEDALVRTGQQAPMACKLHQPVAEVMSFVFNPANYGKSKASSKARDLLLPDRHALDVMEIGYVLLQKISQLVDRPEYAREKFAKRKYGASFDVAVNDLSKRYNALIHELPRFPLNDHGLIRLEYEFLSSFIGQAVISKIMYEGRSQAKVHKLDRIFTRLNLAVQEVQRQSGEFNILRAYLMLSVGHTHTRHYQILNILRIDRADEAARFQSLKDACAQVDRDHRRLLWHGTTCASFTGILTQGLKIRKDDSRSVGMFGRGIYFADMSSKSAQYCDIANFQREGLLLLCEVQLGAPMLEYTSARHQAQTDAKQQGMIAAMGKGNQAHAAWRDAGCLHSSLKGAMIPDMSRAPVFAAFSTSLYYNEYVIWDESQVRLRYVFHVKIF